MNLDFEILEILLMLKIEFAIRLVIKNLLYYNIFYIEYLLYISYLCFILFLSFYIFIIYILLYSCYKFILNRICIYKNNNRYE